MERKIEELRDKLNKLVLNQQDLCSDEILKLSTELDELICIYYKKNRLA